jgi:hypothetical protein
MCDVSGVFFLVLLLAGLILYIKARCYPTYAGPARDGVQMVLDTMVTMFVFSLVIYLEVDLVLHTGYR